MFIKVFDDCEEMIFEGDSEEFYSLAVPLLRVCQ